MRVFAALMIAAWGLAAVAQPSTQPVAVKPRALLGTAAPDDLVDPLLRVLERDPSQAGTWMDLAVVLCQRGRGAESRRVLSHIEDALAPPEGIREVIKLLRDSSCDDRERSVKWSASVQRGYEDNVNQGASNPFFELGSAFPGVILPLSADFLPKGDRYALVDASLNWSGGPGLQLNALLREKQYDQLGEYSTRVAAMGVDREWACGDSRCGVGATLGQIDLGGRTYQYLANVQAARVLPGNYGGGTLGLEGGLTRQVFPNQSSLNAWIAVTKLSWRLPTATGGLLQLSGSVAVDLPTADRPGGKRTLGAVSASGTHPLLPGYQADWLLQAQITRDGEVYSPGLIDTVRKPLLEVLNLGLSKTLASGQRIRMEWRQADNRDTVSLFSYRTRSLGVSWLWRGDI